MNSIQYTIRSIPTKLDQALRQKSKSTGKSLNEVVITALEKGAGVTTISNFDDLDWFIGSKSLSDSFDEYFINYLNLKLLYFPLTRAILNPTRLSRLNKRCIYPIMGLC